jgi:hypothetical protein
MISKQSSPFLRRVLMADSIVSGASGVLSVVGAGVLGDLLHLPTMLLAGAGAVLLPYAAFVGYLGARSTIPTVLVWVVIAANALWTVECLMLLLSGWIAPNSLGIGFILVQALTTAIFAELQYAGLRRGTPVLA